MDLNNFFTDLNDTLYSKEMELAAIWMDKPVVTSNERTVRLTNGHEVRIDGNAIVDCTPNKPATHRIISCHGTISSSKLGFRMVDISTGESFDLKVK